MPFSRSRSRSHSCSRSTRVRVESLPNSSRAVSDAVHTTEPAEEPHIGLFDLPPDDPRSLEFVDGPRQSRPTKRKIQYQAGRGHDNRKRSRSLDTRARNRSLQRTQPNGPASQAVTDKESEQPNHSDTDDVRVPASRAGSLVTRPLARSSSPGATHNEFPGPTQASGDTEYTYEYNSIDHQGLIEYAKEEFGLDVGECDTQTIINKLRVAEAEQASQMGSSRRPSSIIVLPPTSFQVGGGWSQQVVDHNPATGPSKRPYMGDSQRSDETGKRQHKEIVLDDHTAMDLEAEDGSTTDPPCAREVAEHLLTSCDSALANANARPPQRGTQAPPPSRELTPATVIDLVSPHTSLRDFGVSISPTQSRSLACIDSLPSRSQGATPVESQPYVDGETYEDDPSLVPLPGILTRVCGPVHSRLRQRAHSKALEEIGDRVLARHRRSLVANKQIVDGQSAAGRVLDTLPLPTQASPHNSRTYRGRRSHVQSQTQTGSVDPTNSNAHSNELLNEPLESLNEPTVADLVQLERTRAVVTKTRDEMGDRLVRHRRLFTTTPPPPSSRPQPRPAPRQATAGVQRVGGSSRRLDPVSAAREDMIAFNRAVAQGEAESFVDSVTQRNKRTTLHAAPESRPAHGLLDDNEVELSQAEAYAKSKWPRHNCRVRKRKPLARDFSGLERQVLVMAKIHLLAYALVEGIYQTRTTYLRWAKTVYQATWEMELPNQPYIEPADSVFEIMVNSIATARGKVKERLREFVARVAGFRHTTNNQQTIEENLIRFNRLYPNSFHCKTVNPRSGDYENSEIGHCIALAIFNGPTSVGVLYPDYFKDIPLTTVAFALAMVRFLFYLMISSVFIKVFAFKKWQFCIEEWANGWRQSGDLGMSAMHDKYEAQLAGLKTLRDVAPRRMNRLQDEWKCYVVEYSGASFELEETQDLAGKSQIRPDTPEPQVVSARPC
ncbi:LON domain serine protease, putative [Rhizoctonia solani AG-1 IB]|uniref:LON domain serine protease, putative n=1 Tax=Thanatephorus cucumeris (strain AG1-IB / isolate 7/3/14) TaxID=1108050 RepID=A0A0B7FMX3_THACB|nr:LON domain serine protease, putative [Rhizoctonia solani AG-1 IB]